MGFNPFVVAAKAAYVHAQWATELQKSKLLQSLQDSIEKLFHNNEKTESIVGVVPEPTETDISRIQSMANKYMPVSTWTTKTVFVAIIKTVHKTLTVTKSTTSSSNRWTTPTEPESIKERYRSLYSSFDNL